MKLVVGLGNPGSAYAHNRHNIGFRCINYLSKVYSVPIKKQQGLSRVGVGKIAGVDVVLAKPQTFVNNSGKAVSPLVQCHKVPPSDLITIYDDLDLPLGKIRLRQGGSSGGHKGIESIISAIGNGNFTRVRIGIGRPTQPDGTPITDEDAIADYVLSNFTPHEEEIIKPAITKLADVVYCILTEGIHKAMNRFN